MPSYPVLITGALVTSSGITIAACSVTMIIFVVTCQVRMFNVRMMMYLFFSQLFTALVTIFARLEFVHGDPTCERSSSTVLAYLLQIGVTATIVWTLLMGIALAIALRNIGSSVNPWKRTARLEKWFLLAFILATMIPPVTMAAGDLVGPAILYCWVGNRYWRLVIYLYECVVLVAILVLLLKSRRIHNQAVQLMDRDHRFIATATSTAETSYGMLVLMRGILIATLICWLPSIANRILEATGFHVQWMDVVQAGSFPLAGGVCSLLLTWNSLSEMCCKRRHQEAKKMRAFQPDRTAEERYPMLYDAPQMPTRVEVSDATTIQVGSWKSANSPDLHNTSVVYL